MGLLVDGAWKDRWYDTQKTKGEFVRQQSRFRHWVTTDGSAGPSGEGGFAAESGRYHLYVSLACPWAHRTLIARALLGLEGAIGVTVVDPVMAENGWEFSAVSRDNPVAGLDYLHQLYTRAESDYTGRVTVPVLWDKQRNTIVNNESADILRMLHTAFGDLAQKPRDFYPEPLREEIDGLNERIYDRVNNGVYRAGFATTQEAYEKAFHSVFAELDWLEERLSARRFLSGTEITEADIRLFTTLIRFDPVYHGHFKCNRQTLSSYPNLWGYVRDFYQLPGVADTVDFGHIKTHYYVSHTMINPTGVVPKGPKLDLQADPGRAHLSEAS